VRQRRPGHGRLLGGQREMREMDREEAARVVQRGQEAFDELVEVKPVDQELQVDGKDGNQTTAHRGAHQFAILLAIARDVVFAALGRTLDDLARELRERRTHQMPDAAPRLRRPDQLGNQVRVPSMVRGIDPCGEEQIDTCQASLHPLDLEHHLYGNTVFLEILVDLARGCVATVEQAAEVIEPMDECTIIVRQSVLAQCRDGAVQAEERCLVHAPTQAAADRLTQPRRPHLAHQNLDAGRQRRLARLAQALDAIAFFRATIRTILGAPQQRLGKPLDQFVVECLYPVSVVLIDK
jgi:hypothetical protein